MKQLLGFNVKAVKGLGTETHAIRFWQFETVTAGMDALIRVRLAYERLGWTVETSQVWGV